MKIKDISAALELLAPKSLAESYDNVGLLVGDPNADVTGVLINLDVTEDLIDEAIAKGANLIITHHPIWFMGRKRLNGEDYVSRIIIKAIKNDIGLYACHTNLDNVQSGVNEMIGQKLGVADMKILNSKQNLLLKLEAVLPEEMEGEPLMALSEFSEAGLIVEEGGNGNILIEMVVPSYRKAEILATMRTLAGKSDYHFHFIPVNGSHKSVGSGMVGNLPEAMDKSDFLAHVKTTFACGGIRYADAATEKIKKIAWCGGAGSFLTNAAIRAGADAFITGDITYHKYFDNENRILLLDIGHYESEQFTSNLIYNYLSKSFPKFAVRLSEIKTNPVKYF